MIENKGHRELGRASSPRGGIDRVSRAVYGVYPALRHYHRPDTPISAVNFSRGLRLRVARSAQLTSLNPTNPTHPSVVEFSSLSVN
ncbi:hypothetical protein PM082_009825 [Marasmius tenuissimus]|nr:hypothetical protein PM082_009825 [Marasmius tenuissimus]